MILDERFLSDILFEINEKHLDETIFVSSPKQHQHHPPSNSLAV